MSTRLAAACSIVTGLVVVTVWLTEGLYFERAVLLAPVLVVGLRHIRPASSSGAGWVGTRSPGPPSAIDHRRDGRLRPVLVLLTILGVQLPREGG